MGLPAILALAVALAMDALAVSIGAGICHGSIRFRDALRIAFFFGSFQALMPVLGWYAGRGFQEKIASVDHWVAFGLLCLIGGHMILESLRGESKRCARDLLRRRVLLMLSVATSVDALIAGVGLACLQVPIAVPATVIGVVTFVLSLLGVRMGKQIGSVFERRAAFCGGLALIAIGTQILISHLTG